MCISPLTSLMMDQVSNFQARGVKTDFIGDSQTDPSVRKKVLRGELELVYTTPESLINNCVYREMLMSPVYKENLRGLVVDEAHCVKTWGDEFRTTFAEIGTLRSLVSSKVNVMALTATATTTTYHIVIERLSMVDTVLVAQVPFRDNISYHVKRRIDSDTLSTLFSQELKKLRNSFPKTLIYVRTYTDCYGLYMLLKKKLGRHFTEPEGYPNMYGYRLIDMFNRAMTPAKKEEVVKCFCERDTTLRVVIATTAFGLGIDCPDIRQVIHWGIPVSLEEYVQESGQCGRDGKQSKSILYLGKTTVHASKAVLNYLSNSDKCRRRLLFREFLLYKEDNVKARGCECCDVCALSCFCSNCLSLNDVTDDDYD